MTVNMYACMQVFEYFCLQVCKYLSIYVFKYFKYLRPHQEGSVALDFGEISFTFYHHLLDSEEVHHSQTVLLCQNLHIFISKIKSFNFLPRIIQRALSAPRILGPGQMVVVGALWTWILELQDLDKAEQFLRQNIYSNNNNNNIKFISNFAGAIGFDLIQVISVIVIQSAMCNIPLTSLWAKYF